MLVHKRHRGVEVKASTTPEYLSWGARWGAADTYLYICVAQQGPDGTLSHRCRGDPGTVDVRCAAKQSSHNHYLMLAVVHFHTSN